MPDPQNNPSINEQAYDRYAEKFGLDTGSIDRDQVKTKYEYDISLEDGKGAIPLDIIMNPNKTNQASVWRPSWLFTNRCPDYPRMPNFDENAYSGTWYQAFRDKRDPFQTGELGVSEYQVQDDGTVSVKSSEWRLKRIAKQMNLGFRDLGDKVQDLADKFTNYGRARIVPTPNKEPILRIKFG